MTPETVDFHGFITNLLQDAEAVTFYEAITVVHRARQLTGSPATCALLVRLHDGARTTDGAREVLRPYLKSETRRLADAYALAQRPIRPKDSGKTARAACGQMLTLRFNERRASGILWQILQVRGPATCERRLDRADVPTEVEFAVHLTDPGEATLYLQESGARAPGLRPRHFVLHIVVEAA